MNIVERFLKAGDAWAVDAGNLAVTTCREQYLNGQALNRGKHGGNLVNKVYAKKLQGAAFKFGTNVKYGIYWEKGWDHSTVITPKNKKVLCWRSHIGNRIVKDRGTGMYKAGKRMFSDWMFAKRVVLPPQKARPFLWPTLEQNAPEMKSMADREYQKVFDSIPNYEIHVGV